jgi:Uma2 family endonuclease
MEALRKEEYYTYADYLGWETDERYELIDGLPYAMSPAPGWFHESVSVEIVHKLRSFLEGKTCKVFSAPFDVRLNADGADDTVVQPDVTVVCDRSKLSDKGKGCNGAPDLAVEILSPSSAKMDRIVKYKQYEKYGVREYWLVDPTHKTVEVYTLVSGKYEKAAYADGDTVPVGVLPGCEVDLATVFME